MIKKIEKRNVSAALSGGAADACYMSRPDLMIIDGLGPTGGGMHTPNEFINLDSLRTRALALTAFLESYLD